MKLVKVNKDILCSWWKYVKIAYGIKAQWCSQKGEQGRLYYNYVYGRNGNERNIKETGDPGLGNGIWTNVVANVKKTGTSTVSFKTGGKTYKIKVTVKKYKNPISSVKIGNTTIRGSKFKSTSNYFLKWSKFKGENTKVTVKLAKGWKFCHKEFDDESGKLRPVILAYPGSFPKKVVPTVINGQSIKIKGKKGYTLNFTVEQRSTGRTEDISIIFK